MISICSDPPMGWGYGFWQPLTSQQICHSFATSLPTRGPITIVHNKKSSWIFRLDFHTPKTNMTMEKQPFEYVFPIISYWKMVIFHCHISFCPSIGVSPLRRFPHHQSFQGFLRISTGSKHQAMQGITSWVSFPTVLLIKVPNLIIKNPLFQEWGMEYSSDNSKYFPNFCLV